MKKFLVFFMLSLLPLTTMAQAAGGQVRRPVKKQQTVKPPARKPATTATPPARKPATTATRQGNSVQNATTQQSVGSSASLSPVLQNLLFNMVRVEGGTFTMGATAEQGGDALDGEKPAHQVTLSSFSIGKYEVTQEEWEAVMGSNPSRYGGSKRPVEMVSWDDCQQFIRKLNDMTGKQFRLPTEAEWEYAARGGRGSRGFKYAGSGDNLGSVAWYDGNAGSETHPVGQKQPNELGLYDMSGNVNEWCQDWYDKDYYGKSPSSNPVNETSASKRVHRGGSWYFSARYCRVSHRYIALPDHASYILGFRLAL